VAFHGGDLVSPTSLAVLTRARHRFRRGIHYGAATMTLRFGELMPVVLRGLPEPVGHLGVWATHVFHHPVRRMGASFRAHAAIARAISALPVAGSDGSVG
jgi:D-alanyl-D-alanine carboxypeptidase